MKAKLMNIIVFVLNFSGFYVNKQMLQASKN